MRPGAPQDPPLRPPHSSRARPHPALPLLTQVEERNSDYAKIVRLLRFENTSALARGHVAPGTTEGGRPTLAALLCCLGAVPTPGSMFMPQRCTCLPAGSTAVLAGEEDAGVADAAGGGLSPGHVRLRSGLPLCQTLPQAHPASVPAPAAGAAAGHQPHSQCLWEWPGAQGR